MPLSSHRRSPAFIAAPMLAVGLACGFFAACSTPESLSPASALRGAQSGAGGAGASTAGSGGAAPDAGTDADAAPPVEYPACQGPDPKGAPFSDGPYGIASRDLADDFTLPTIDGDWSFKEHWTGCDSYVFVLYAKGYQYADDLWKSAAGKLLSASPPNVHYFFLSYDPDAVVATADVQKMKDKMDVALGKLSDEARAAWMPRVHYVTAGARSMDNWISDMLIQKGVFSFAIDRFQAIRQVGLLVNVATGSQTGKLDFVTNEVVHYNFEWDREQALAAEKDVTVIPVLKAEPSNWDVDVELPDAATMAGFDTMEIDLSFGCTDHLDENCGAWDYIANLLLCDEADPTSCPIEFGRWITTYGREGRWVTDVSPMLALLKKGGTRRFHLNPANSYVVDMSFRFMNRGTGSVPDEAAYLFSGGGFNQTYNDKYTPVTFEVPADVKRVQIAALITGHGWGAEADNCAEFCNHDHHFMVNGTDHVKDHPMAGTSHGCLDQIPDGAVPNQYGTWPLGRGGWCPGLDVKPWVVDITSDVVIGGTNTLSYQGFFKGETYVPKPGNPNSGGFGANITMSSWLIYSR